uniref:N-acetyltransferase domain-containing protein n=1 Tax=Ditylenchus dipsaci TaxID=166011 RepID=A0A915EVJ3_9BILA
MTERKRKLFPLTTKDGMGGVGGRCIAPGSWSPPSTLLTRGWSSHHWRMMVATATGQMWFWANPAPTGPVAAFVFVQREREKEQFRREGYRQRLLEMALQTIRYAGEGTEHYLLLLWCMEGW